MRYRVLLRVGGRRDWLDQRRELWTGSESTRGDGELVAANRSVPPPGISTYSGQNPGRGISGGFFEESDFFTVQEFAEGGDWTWPNSSSAKPIR